MAFKMPDQRSTSDQLDDLEKLAVEHGLYDAHDWLRQVRNSTKAKFQDPPPRVEKT